MSGANILLPALAVLGLICMSAFFSGSETGLTSVAREKIHALKMEGNRRAETLGLIREDTEGLIGAILLGNNVVNIAASAIATAIAIELFGQSGVVFGRRSLDRDRRCCATDRQFERQVVRQLAAQRPI